MNYNYATANNGQVQSITDNLDATRSASYSYDAWARLKTATAGNPTTPTWSLSYDYDRFGNRRNQNVIGGTGPGVSLTIDQNTNRIQDTGYAYDSSGNMTNDTFHSYAYDGENRTKTVDSTGATYTYSGALRVKKVVGATTTVYIFSGSKVLAEYANGSLSKEYVYAGAQLLTTVAADGTTTYQHPDHLSTRVETDANGASSRTFGHYPFGESWYETGTTSKWKFTSYERDDESGLDQAVFRYDSSRLGRFMQADLLAGRIYDPQSLNRYSYVRNDPIGLVDPFGLNDQSVFIEVPPPPPDPSQVKTLVVADGGPCEFYTVNAGGQIDGYFCGLVQLNTTDQKRYDQNKKALLEMLKSETCKAFLDKQLQSLGFNAGNVAAAVENQVPYSGNKSTVTFGEIGSGFENYDANQTVSGYFKGSPGTYAVAQTPGNIVFFKQGGLFNTDSVQSVIIGHEALHNLTGKGDIDLAQQLGVGPGGAGTGSDSQAINAALAAAGCAPSAVFHN